ncbi:MAG: hypothetical protein P8Q23_10240, partial [Paracoccaceae bacterium]|nr:hypothetical protein [Paracoccaceae bacterium]
GDNYLSLCGPKKSDFQYGMPGTMISMSMNVTHLKYLETRLKEISDWGERVAKSHLSSGKDVMASAASKLIMQD